MSSIYREGSFVPMSSGADGEYEPDKATDTPCVHPILWIGTYTEYFRGKANLPTDWIDAYGVPTSDIVITNQHSCADIGTIIKPGQVPTGRTPHAVCRTGPANRADPSTSV